MKETNCYPFRCRTSVVILVVNCSMTLRLNHYKINHSMTLVTVPVSSLCVFTRVYRYISYQEGYLDSTERGWKEIIPISSILLSKMYTRSYTCKRSPLDVSLVHVVCVLPTRRLCFTREYRKSSLNGRRTMTGRERCLSSRSYRLRCSSGRNKKNENH